MPTKCLCRSRSDDPNRGFTIVELLVAISMMMLLIALLLPALGKARNQATRIKCAVNLRQVGVGNEVYMTDHEDWMPVFGNTPATGLYAWSVDEISSYMHEIWPSTIRWCPTLFEISDSTVHGLGFHPLSNDAFARFLQWGYTLAMVNSTARGYMHKRLDASQRFIRPRQPGLGVINTPPYNPAVYYGARWDPSGTRPMAFDMIHTAASGTRVTTPHATGQAKGVAWVEPPGGNGLWEDGHVRWQDWPGQRVTTQYRAVATKQNGSGEADWANENNMWFFARPSKSIQ